MFILTAVVLLVIGGPLLAFAVVFDILCVAFIPLALLASTRRTAKATGEVVGIEEQRGQYSARARVAYDTAEGRFETRARLRGPRLGEPVAIRYPAGKPSRGQVINSVDSRRTLLIAFPVVAVITALSAGMVISAVWYFAGSHTGLRTPLGYGSFIILFAVLCGIYTVNRYMTLARRRQMVPAEGKIVRYKEPLAGTGGPGSVTISFQSGHGEEEFRAPASTVPAGTGDTVTVFYHPDKPAQSAMLETAGRVRRQAMLFTAFTVILGALGVLMFMFL